MWDIQKYRLGRANLHHEIGIFLEVIFKLKPEGQIGLIQGLRARCVHVCVCVLAYLHVC